jgi:hypothetical protein
MAVPMKFNRMFFIRVAILMLAATAYLLAPAASATAPYTSKAAAFIRDSDAYAFQQMKRVDALSAQINPIDWHENLGGAALISRARIEKSRLLITKTLRLIERRQKLVLEGRTNAENFIRTYGLAPADYEAAYSSFRQALMQDMAVSDEIWNARMQLYQSALDVLSFAQRMLGRSSWQDGRYTLSQPDDQREFERLLGLLKAASTREGVAVTRFEAYLDSKSRSAK